MRDAMSMLTLFRGNETTVASVARWMLRLGLTPADVLAAHDAWMAERMREMVPAKGAGSVKSDEQSGGKQLRSPHSALHTRQNSTPKKRRKAGDLAVMPRACPRCGGDVEMLQLCPQASPVWRTQLACMANACAWHGRSRLPIDALLAAGAARIKNNVIEG